MIDNLCVFVTNAEILHMQDFIIFFFFKFFIKIVGRRGNLAKLG